MPRATRDRARKNIAADVRCRRVPFMSLQLQCVTFSLKTSARRGAVVFVVRSCVRACVRARAIANVPAEASMELRNVGGRSLSLLAAKITEMPSLSVATRVGADTGVEKRSITAILQSIL